MKPLVPGLMAVASPMLWSLPLSGQCDEPSAVLTPNDGAPGDSFGSALDISDNLLIVGAPGDDDHPCGSAYIFRNNGTEWLQEQEIVPADEDCAYFGAWGSVAIDEDAAVVFSLLEDSGYPPFDYAAGYVFRFDGVAWNQEAKLFPNLTEDFDHYYGMAVDIEADVLVLGEWWDQTLGGWAPGAIEVFRYDGAQWSLDQQLLASDGSAEKYFGYPVALSGDVLITGAFGDDENGSFAGAAYIFRFDGGRWVQEQKLLASDGEFSDFFGYGVDIEEDVAAVYAAVDEGGFYVGAVYVFRFDGDAWQEEQILAPPKGETLSEAIAVRGNLIMVGPRLFQFDGTTWQEIDYLTRDQLEDLNHGNPVALNAFQAAVGDDTNSANGPFSGAIVQFDISCLTLPPCSGDANGDNIVDPLDSGYILARFGCVVGKGDPLCDAADVNADGLVDPLDVGFVLSRFGECE